MILDVKGHKVLIDDEDYELVSKYKWSVREYASGRNVVLNQKWEGETNRNVMTYIHRLVTNAPNGMVVDHINGNCLDNRKENLRICTKQENIRNQKTQSRNKSSIYKGVYKCKRTNRYRARCKFEGKYYETWWDTEIEAAKAYNELAKKYHGDFARFNIVEGE